MRLQFLKKSVPKLLDRTEYTQIIRKISKINSNNTHKFKRNEQTVVASANLWEHLE
jgi:hypothetical protein